MAGININQGTQTNLATDTIGTINYGIVKIDRGAAGLSSLFTGTIDAITNLATGTIANVGNLAKGTLTEGTVSTLGLVHPNAWATVVSTGTTTLGTIKAAVAGSQIFVTDITISTGSATTIVIGNGGTSTPLIGTLSLAQFGGMVANYRTPLASTSGSAITFQQSVGCPMTITAQGYVK